MKVHVPQAGKYHQITTRMERPVNFSKCICFVLALLLPSLASAQDLIANKRVDSVFFGLIKPGIARARTAGLYPRG